MKKRKTESIRQWKETKCKRLREKGKRNSRPVYECRHDVRYFAFQNPKQNEANERKKETKIKQKQWQQKEDRRSMNRCIVHDSYIMKTLADA